MIRELLSYLPQNNRDDPPRTRMHRSRRPRRTPRSTPSFPPRSNQPYDIKDVIQRVVDDGEFFEVQEHLARNIVVGLRAPGRPHAWASSRISRPIWPAAWISIPP